MRRSSRKRKAPARLAEPSISKASKSGPQPQQSEEGDETGRNDARGATVNVSQPAGPSGDVDHTNGPTVLFGNQPGDVGPVTDFVVPTRLNLARSQIYKAIKGREEADSKPVLGSLPLSRAPDHLSAPSLTQLPVVSNFFRASHPDRCLNLGISPIRNEVLQQCLKSYPSLEDAQLLLEGFKNGFRIAYNGPRSAFECDNLRSAYDHKFELLQKLQKEISMGRIAGPFRSAPFLNLHVSPIGLVPKSDGGWRLITHLSYPPGTSINDGIDEALCTVKYISFDQVTSMVHSLGHSALIAKRDLKSAYRLLPIHTADFPLLGMKVDDDYYIDKFLPMGLSQSACLFEKFSTFLHWLVAERANNNNIAHLLDDFLLAGSRNSNACQVLVDTFEATCSELGVPIAKEKSVNPTTVMVFLGLELDTTEMSVRIPQHKLIELEGILKVFLSRRKVSLKELQSLVGKLNFFGQAVRSSRAFLRRFYDAMKPLVKPHHVLRVSAEMKSDLRVWLEFLSDFNGVTYIPQDCWFTSSALGLFTDAAGSFSLGAACYINGSWCFFPWPETWEHHPVLKDMAFLEMVPVLLVIYLWGVQLANKKVNMFIDNEALVKVINKQSSKSKILMQLVRPFVLQCMKLNITFRAVHVPSKSNIIADSISRQQWARFRRAAPDADPESLPIPPLFAALISRLKLDA